MRNVTLLAPLLWVLPGLCTPVAAEPPAGGHDITPDDYFTLAYIDRCVVAPDGRHVAYTERRWVPEEDARNTDLWVVSTETKTLTRLTFDPAADGNPSWSPDGRWLYFTSARTRGDEGERAPSNGKRQVWRVSVDGGDVAPVTRIAQGIEQYELSRDGGSLYYTVGEEQVETDAWKALRTEFDELEYGHGVVTFSKLWRLDLETWRAEKLVDDRRVIRAFTVAPDERRIAMITTPDNTLLSNEGWSKVEIHDTDAGTTRALPDRAWREDAPSPYGWIVSPCWSSDGAALAFRVDFDGYPGELFVAAFTDGSAPAVVKMTRPDEVSVGGRMAWRPGTDDLCFVADDHARARVYGVSGLTRGRQERHEILTPGDVVVDDFDFTRDGRRLVVLRSGLDHPPDLFEVGPGSPDRRLTKVNPQVDGWKLPSVEVFRWQSPDGTPVEGILELPPGHHRDAPLPLVVHVHGGPTASSKYRFQFWTSGRTLFAARGWALLSPNYRGSTGYGDRFLTDLIGNENHLDVQDILAGVDALVDAGIADPDQMAVIGWSNGGYLTNCLITRTDRFKAASSGAGVFDMVMQWSIEDTPGHVINYSRGLPWEQIEEMREMSPLYDVHRVRTPTLIHVGERDERVPPAHSRALHRALYRYLGVPAELIVYPGAGHGLTRYAHRRAKLRWDVAWFDHYVLGKSTEHE